jgi:glycosyltransferase involved in cell wall biosynthesis
MNQGRLCLVANTEWYLFNFRLPLAKELRSIGWEVILISPPGPSASKLVEEGFEWLEWQVDRRGLSLFRELISAFHLGKIYKEKRPLLVHHFTVKPVMYGSLAARLAKVPAVVNSITGLGYIFLRTGWQGSVLRGLVKPLYRLAIKRDNVRVIFENKDDEKFFLLNHLASKAQTIVIEGVGVNVERYQPHPEEEGKPLVVLPARLLWDKGVGVLVDAAGRLREGGDQSSIRIALVGIPDEGNPASIEEAQLQKWIADGLVEHWGFRQDMDLVYRQAHIVCLPSLREGLPTVLIEAAAAGKPIVASDVPGCREVVEHGKNGLLVPPGDPAALAEALALLAENPSLRQKMGAAGRMIAVNRFANEKIIAATLNVYSDLLKTI